MIKKLLLSLLLSLTLFNCSQDKSIDLFYYFVTGNELNHYTKMAVDGVLLWDIYNPAKIEIEKKRWTDDKHWITITGDDCIAEGVPKKYHGKACPLGRGYKNTFIIGYFFADSHYEDGTLKSSTIVLLDRFMEDKKIFTEEEKMLTITHEVGHLLGLRHTFAPKRSMTITANFYPPAEEEQEIIKYIYLIEPNKRVYPYHIEKELLYFHSYKIQHREIPTITIDANMGM